MWEQLVERFGIVYVGEFYASTEGNANLINNQNRRGAIGFISPLIKRKYPVKASARPPSAAVEACP